MQNQGRSKRPLVGSRKSMSILQAILQDPVPMDVYIALRPDGVLGSGTEADPWTGGDHDNTVTTEIECRC